MASTKKQHIVRGVILNWLARFSAIFIAFVVTPIIIKGLGNTTYGIWSILMSLGSYYALADLGFRGATVKYIAEYEAKNDFSELQRIFDTSLYLFLFLGTLVLVAGGVMTWIFPYCFKVPAEMLSSCRYAVMITAASVAVKLFFQVFGATLQAVKRFDITTSIAISNQVLLALFLVTAIRRGYGLATMAMISFILTLVSQLALAFFTFRCIHYLRIGKTLFGMKQLKLFSRFASFNVLINFSRQISDYMGALLIGFFLSPAVVTFYELANSLVVHTQAFSKGVFSVIMPISSQLGAENRIDDLGEMGVQLTRIMFSASFFVVGCFGAFGFTFLELWMGISYAYESYSMLLFLGLAYSFSMIGDPFRPLLTGLGELSYITKLSLGGAAATLILAFVLIPTIGFLGMGWAIIIPKAVVGIVLLPLHCCRRFHISYSKYLILVIGKGIIGALPGIILAFTFAWLIPAKTIFFELVVQGICATFVCGVSLWFICFSKQLRRELFYSLFPRRQKKS